MSLYASCIAKRVLRVPSRSASSLPLTRALLTTASLARASTVTAAPFPFTSSSSFTQTQCPSKLPANHHQQRHYQSSAPLRQSGAVPGEYPDQTIRQRQGNMSANDKFRAEKLFDLSGKVALVTGGGSGIGLMATQALAANGCKVYITGRTESKLDNVVSKYNKDQPGSIHALPGNVTSKDGIQKLYEAYSAKEDCLCILVNNAGVSSEHHTTESEGDASEMRKNLFEAEQNTFEDWSDTYSTNVSSLYFMTTAFLPLLQRSSEKHSSWSSSVINITSISGLVKVPQHHFAYNASKAAALHLTRALSNQVADNSLRIRINSIAPGVFPSEMTAGESNEDQKSHIPKENFEGKVPANRPGKDEDMAQSVLYAAGCQYLNGVHVVVDGGYTIQAGM